MKRNWMLLSFVMACVLLSAGCASTIKNEAAGLALDGQAATGRMSGAMGSTSQDVQDKMYPALAFSVGYNGLADNENVRKMVLERMNRVKSLIKLIAVYKAMVQELGKAYAALGKLTSYDASGEFETAFADFTTKADGLLGAVKSGAKLPDDVKTGARKAGSFAIGYLQDKYIKDSSKDIKVVLVYMVGELSKPSVRDGIVGTAVMIQESMIGAAKELYDNGMYSYTPMLDSLGEPLGMKSIKTADEKVASKIKVRNGLMNVVDESVRMRLDAIAEVYDDCLNELKKLVARHDKIDVAAHKK